MSTKNCPFPNSIEECTSCALYYRDASVAPETTTPESASETTTGRCSIVQISQVMTDIAGKLGQLLPSSPAKPVK